MKVSLSTTLSVPDVITGAIKSTTSLHATIGQDRDMTLRRLHIELGDVANILDSLAKVNDVEALAFLRGPIDRCGQVCYKFEQLIKVFCETPTTGFRDWRKMEFMGGDMKEFIETVSGYKSTILVGLGTILHTCNASQEVLLGYQEMIQNTTYDLQFHLKQIEERKNQMSDRQSLLICQHAKAGIESLRYQASTLQEINQTATEDDMQNSGQLSAVTLTCQTLHGIKERLGETIGRLEEQNNRNSRNDNELLELRKEGIATRQCLVVVKNARSEVNPQLINCSNLEKAFLEAIREHYETVVESTSDDGV